MAETSEKKARFEGFDAAAFDWFVGLELDNSREYFLAHREVYEAKVRVPFEALLTELAEEFGGTPKIFRPNRDIRFSNDKSLYKTTTSGYLQVGTDYYLQLSSEGLMAATGYYQMAKDQLQRYRAALTGDDAKKNAAALRKLMPADALHKGIQVEGEALKTAPRGIARDHPNVDLLRQKSLILHATLDFDKATRKRSLDHVAELWRASAPLNKWLATHVGPTTLVEERR